MKPSKKQLKILKASGHLLVTGGPGSGKTSISILKATRCVENDIMPGQSVLFLSFARATVLRVVEAIEHEQKIPKQQRERIEIGTYHSFFWRIIKAHGYLVGLPRLLNILRPSSEAAALSVIRSEIGIDNKIDNVQKARKRCLEKRERKRLAVEEARICFDLFAEYAGRILHGSERICKLIANAYPTIILDEFQDTTEDQWHVVKALGEHCQLISLADPEQRIYDWIGANPNRLHHFRKEFNPKEFNLCSDNHRSPGTEILLFGNDVLKGEFSQKKYIGVSRLCYPATYNHDRTTNSAFTALIREISIAEKRLIDSGKPNWSLAILVPTKRLARLTSDKLRNPPSGQSAITHTEVVELEGAILAAEIMAHLLEPTANDKHFIYLVELMCNYFRGRNAGKPLKTDIKKAADIDKACKNFIERSSQGKRMHQGRLLVNTHETYTQAKSLILTGKPNTDWRAMSELIKSGKCTRLKELVKDIRNLRLLGKETQLHRSLVEDWRENNNAYMNALSIVQQAFAQEDFATNQSPKTGVIVMNMHKAKGKQFDEVIIFEGWPQFIGNKFIKHPDRIVWSNSLRNENDENRQNFRVSITRSKSRTTILTPENSPCTLLRNEIDCYLISERAR